MNKKIIESFDVNDWEVETDEGWVDITAVHKTIPYQVYIIKTENYELECADRHILFDNNYNEIFCIDLNIGDIIRVKNDAERVISIEKTDKYEYMYDLELSENSKHRYYTNGILSHNTLLAKQLSKTVYGDEKNMLRIDCSELSESHSISKLLGSPSGYIGYGNNTILDKVKHNPYTVVLIDEIEKAHDNIYNLFLQLFDDGRITDSTGITIDFSNTIIIMTSNVGTKISNDYKPVGFGTIDDDTLLKNRENIIKKQLKNKFPPEFLNRINSIIYFKPLTEKNIKDIIELNLNTFNSIFNDKNEKYGIKWGEEVIEFIFSKISEDDKKLGARPILRLIETHIEEKLTELLIENSYSDNYIFSISIIDDETNII
jgi:hypothetical protein